MSNSLFDELLQGMGSGLADIRAKVVEEPYFGRAVTDGPAAEQPAGSAGPSLGGMVSMSWPATDVPSAWEAQVQQVPASPQIEPPAADHDIDR